MWFCFLESYLSKTVHSTALQLNVLFVEIWASLGPVKQGNVFVKTYEPVVEEVPVRFSTNNLIKSPELHRAPLCLPSVRQHRGEWVSCGTGVRVKRVFLCNP